MLLRLGKRLRIPTIYRNYADYIQGQSPEPRVREYFYYIDHQGLLFLDDTRIKNFTSCFKDVRFITFFFKRLKMNTTGRYTKEFPFVSLCGLERNFLRCDDLPVVFSEIIYEKKNKSETIYLSYCHAGNNLMVPFEPEKLYMNIETGRLYHPAPEKLGGAGLVRSKLTMDISKNFVFQKGENTDPTHIEVDNTRYKLDPSWTNKTILDEKYKIEKENVIKDCQ